MGLEVIGEYADDTGHQWSLLVELVEERLPTTLDADARGVIQGWLARTCEDCGQPKPIGTAWCDECWPRHAPSWGGHRWDSETRHRSRRRRKRARGRGGTRGLVADHIASLSQWEYKARNLDKVPGLALEDDFNKFGREGWEFVAVAKDYAVFKRRLPD